MAYTSAGPQPATTATSPSLTSGLFYQGTGSSSANVPQLADSFSQMPTPSTPSTVLPPFQHQQGGGAGTAGMGSSFSSSPYGSMSEAQRRESFFTSGSGAASTPSLSTPASGSSSSGSSSVNLPGEYQTSGYGALSSVGAGQGGDGWTAMGMGQKTDWAPEQQEILCEYKSVQEREATIHADIDTTLPPRPSAASSSRAPVNSNMSSLKRLASGAELDDARSQGALRRPASFPALNAVTLAPSGSVTPNANVRPGTGNKGNHVRSQTSISAALPRRGGISAGAAAMHGPTTSYAGHSPSSSSLGLRHHRGNLSTSAAGQYTPINSISEFQGPYGQDSAAAGQETTPSSQFFTFQSPSSSVSSASTLLAPEQRQQSAGTSGSPSSALGNFLRQGSFQQQRTASASGQLQAATQGGQTQLSAPFPSRSATSHPQLGSPGGLGVTSWGSSNSQGQPGPAFNSSLNQSQGGLAHSASSPALLGLQRTFTAPPTQFSSSSGNLLESLGQQRQGNASSGLGLEATSFSNAGHPYFQNSQLQSSPPLATETASSQSTPRLMRSTQVDNASWSYSGSPSSGLSSFQQQQQQGGPSQVPFLSSQFASPQQGLSSSNSPNDSPSPTGRAQLKLQGDLNDLSVGWSHDEWKRGRRLVQFWRRQDGTTIATTFRAIDPSEYRQKSIVVSCIYREETDECYITSVDCIYLLEALVSNQFTIEEKNRIRRNLEGFRPMTISKSKPECDAFFRRIMGFGNPKPRNIEKDVKVFPWRVLGEALKKIIGKYSAGNEPVLYGGPAPPLVEDGFQHQHIRANSAGVPGQHQNQNAAAAGRYFYAAQPTTSMDNNNNFGNDPRYMASSAPPPQMQQGQGFSGNNMASSSLPPSFSGYGNQYAGQQQGQQQQQMMVGGNNNFLGHGAEAYPSQHTHGGPGEFTNYTTTTSQGVSMNPPPHHQGAGGYGPSTGASSGPHHLLRPLSGGQHGQTNPATATTGTGLYLAPHEYGGR